MLHRLPARIRRRATGVLLVFATVVAGCGSDETSTETSTATSTEASTVTSAVASTTASTAASIADPSAAGPLTIDHLYGATTIETRPQRIVSLALQWTDVLLALDVQPVGHVVDSLAGENGIYPWQSTISGDSQPIEISEAGMPLEQIAALHPDLILVTYAVETESQYQDLAQIAPTIPLLGDRQVDPWQDLVELAGTFLGEPEQAASVLDGVAHLLDDTAAEYPGLAGKSFALANYVPGDSIYVVADPADGSSLFFQALGMELDPEIVAVGDGVSGRAQFSLEQASLLDADLLIIFSNDGNPNDLPGYAQLPAVAAGAVAQLDYPSVVGLNTPTPLSIPYSLELVRSALAAAAGE